jgi:hypothetical protein
MTLGGWILMIIGVGGTTAGFAWCLWRVLRTPGATERIHSSADLGTPDN